MWNPEPPLRRWARSPRDSYSRPDPSEQRYVLDLKEALDELYRAQVRDRNVPQLGFELDIGEDSIHGIEHRGYRAFIGVPWPVRLPFLRREDSVEFLLAELIVRHDDYSGGIRAVSRELSLTAFLNREISLAFRWQDPGVAPEEVILEPSRPSRFTVSFEYAMGR